MFALPRYFATIFLASASLFAAEPSFHDIKQDISLPAVVGGVPEAGKRVRVTTPGWEKTSVYHTLYLPKNWSPKSCLPVIVEYPGNAWLVKDQEMDRSQGTVEDCALGYGISSGEAIWVCLPSIDVRETGVGAYRQNSGFWWGDVEETKRYCIATVHDVCERFGGDRKRVILAGFSRGGIACFFIGLHDNAIASLWAGFFTHGHFDGVREHWEYEGADRASAQLRLRRLGNRPVWVSGEDDFSGIRKYLHLIKADPSDARWNIKNNMCETKFYLDSIGVEGDFTFVVFPYPDHTAFWTLCDLPIRTESRAWWKRVIALPPPKSNPCRDSGE